MAPHRLRALVFGKCSRHIFYKCRLTTHSIWVCRPQHLHSNSQVQGFYFEKSSSYSALLSWTSCLDPLLLLLLIIMITVEPRVGDMSIDALKVVFGDMLDSRVAPGKQLKKDTKVDRRTTVRLY